MEAFEEMMSGDAELGIHGTIPSSDLDFYISTYRKLPYGIPEKRVRVYINYDWHSTPSWTLTDPYGMAWDDSIWTAEDNSAKNYTYMRLLYIC